MVPELFKKEVLVHSKSYVHLSCKPEHSTPCILRWVHAYGDVRIVAYVRFFAQRPAD